MTSAFKCSGVKFRPNDKCGNSGAGAISVAARQGAERIILLGYDCQHTGGMAHHHEDHPQGLPNATTVKNWPSHFRDLAGRIGHVEIINSSRATALQQWPRMALEQALAGKHV